MNLVKYCNIILHIVEAQGHINNFIFLTADITYTYEKNMKMKKIFRYLLRHQHYFLVFLVFCGLCAPCISQSTLTNHPLYLCYKFFVSLRLEKVEQQQWVYFLLLRDIEQHIFWYDLLALCAFPKQLSRDNKKCQNLCDLPTACSAIS